MFRKASALPSAGSNARKKGVSKPWLMVARKLREEFPKAKHILIGHSNGGITAGMLAVQAKPTYDGFVFSAPNLSDFSSS